MVEKELGCFVQKWTAGNFGTTGNFDEAAFHQRLQHAVDIDTAYSLDIGTGDRLTVGDDGERFQRGWSQPCRFRSGKELAHPLRISRITRQLPALGFFDQLKRVLLPDVFRFQLFERGRDFGFFDICKFVRQKITRFPGTLDYIDNLFCGERFLRAEQKRFNEFRQRHRNKTPVILRPPRRPKELTQTPVAHARPLKTKTPTRRSVTSFAITARLDIGFQFAPIAD